MEIIENILNTTVSLLTSFGIIALIAFIFKEWIKQYISFSFKSKELEKNIEIKLTEDLLSHQIPMKLELSQAVYKSRTYAKDIVNENTPLTYKKDDFQQLTSLLTESLFRYRVLLDNETFNLLHIHKRLCQDFLMYLDVSDRPENIREGEIYFSDSIKEKLNKIYTKIDESYLKIISNFQSNP